MSTKNTTILLFLFLITFFPCGLHNNARAQVVVGGGGPWYRPYGGGYPTYSSTPTEGARRGTADIIRASGEAAEQVSRANINNQKALDQYYDNVVKRTDTYWERRRKGEMEQAQDYRAQQAKTQAYLQKKHSQSVERLSYSELDPVSGAIGWPNALKAPAFAADRAKLEKLFAQRAGSEYVSSADIESACNAMQDNLTSRIRDFPTNEYLEARKFIGMLKMEIQLPPS